MRWQHLVDMREIWQNALANLERIRPNYLSVGDKKLMIQLGSAIGLMDRQIDLMSKYTIGDLALRRMIDTLPYLPKAKDENKNSNP